jgi:RNA polymerase sigma-70 factor (ECF subfamily)
MEALMSTELLDRARGGDRDAFTALVEPHRRGLQVHCYRMLGSVQDAEDVVQETLLAAWLALAGFEGRASVRTWLYRIATNRCLNQLRSATRRPVADAAALPAPAPEPSQLGQVPWLQPFPDSLLDGLMDDAPGPDARYESREAISLAFVRALQLLPPNQRAVLLLRDVLGYRASETGDLLGLSEDAVSSALRRARATMDTAPTAGGAAAPSDSGQRELLERFVHAFVNEDTAALVALMTDDVWVRMPPLPFEYHGHEAARRFFTAVDAHRHAIARMEPVAVNGQAAWGEYVRDPCTGRLHLAGVLVVATADNRISEITHFETVVAPYLGLPRTL